MRYLALLRRLKQRPRGFRSLRRTYRTIAAETGEELAIDLTMGHAESADDMARVYTQQILRSKLKAVAVHVRNRLLG